MKARMRGKRGVTLIEMLFVLVIIGLMASFMIPQIDIPKFQIEGTMQSVGTLMLAAQRLAVSRQHDVVVKFDVTNQQIRIFWDKNNDGIIATTEHVQTIFLGEKVVFGRGFAAARPMGPNEVSFTQLSGGQPAMTFHRNGSGSEEGGFYLTSQRAALGFTKGKDDTRAIEVERATGRVRWLRYYKLAWKQGF